LLYLPGLYALWFRKSLQESGQSKQPDLAPQHQAKDGVRDHVPATLAFPLADAAE
jgi:multidrug efflux pump